ncbi:hypothetical protein [Sandaracinobacteroides saxicola]|uniref:hypothetical protein n=1 Tax=Sandaracinobacteroides saxicola TaxID=2759707 RepID=UPI001FB17FBD|nr:hypothetical protein [Sandaracinobacteroides saxicola]
MTDPKRDDNLAPETFNREQADEGQAQDVADDAMHGDHGHDPLESHKPRADRTAAVPDDTPDLVDRMKEMLRSGHIDNDAYAGEPMHDDEEDELGDTEGDEDEAALMEGVADDGDDPLGDVASEHGLEDEDLGDDADDDEVDVGR